jgi:DNA-binding transcriptional regulator YiaG
VNLKHPSKHQVKKARLASGLTQTQAAAIIGYSMRAWQDWESGARKMRRFVFDKFVELTHKPE